MIGAVLGSVADPRFAGRREDSLPVAWHEATRRRLRRTTEAGVDVAVDVPAGGYLYDGAVLLDDGERVVVVRRPQERAVRVTFDAALPREELIAAVAKVTHAFGNQHVPVEAVAGELRAPVTTSDEIAVDTVRSLGLAGVKATVEDLPLGTDHPLSAGHGHS